jgi:FkbM family methyltransferase
MTIKKELIKLIDKSLNLLDLELAMMQSKKEKEEQYQFIQYLHRHQESYSQLYQDLFVQYMLNNKNAGFFVEFGATNGVTLSNTYLLEKKYNWRGVLAEPAKIWHADLLRNRTALVDTRCVWSKSGEVLQFSEVSDAAEVSTLTSFTGLNEQSAASDHIYKVETISLDDLLLAANAPHSIDYLSIDTEGSEYEILSNFDFDRWDISIITVEHNFFPIREKLYKLLTSKGYVRKFPQLSRWDDWYVKATLS